MKSSCNRIVLTLGLILVTTGTLYAGPVEDLQRGTDVRLQLAFFLNGGFYVRDLTLSKPARMLDASFNARAIGMPSDLIIPLVGGHAGNTITWNFDLSRRPAVSIRDRVTLARIRGALVMRASLLPPDSDPLCTSASCPYNVQLDSASGTWATITIISAGISRDIAIEAIHARAYGGLPRPRLFGFWLNAPPRPDVAYCSRHEPTYITGSVGTVAPVPVGGAWVAVTSSDDVHAAVLGAFIPEGSQFVPIAVRIAPEWSGSVTLTATAGGVVTSVPLHVGPPDSCARPWTWLLSTVYSCLECLNVRWINTPGDVIGDLAGKLIFVSRDAKTRGPLTSLYGLGDTSLYDTRLNNRGQLWGTFDRQGRSAAVIANPPWEGKATGPLVLDGVRLAAVNDMGIAAGTRTQDKQSKAVIINGGYVLDLPLKADWSRAVALNTRGQFVGVMSNAGRTSSFVYTNGGVEDIGNLGEGPSTATAISEGGDITGFAPFKQQMHAFLARRGSSGKWAMKDLGLLPGFDSMRPTAINAAGIVVGVASGKSGTTAFLYSPQIGLVDMNQLIVKAGMQLSEAVMINDANQILANGTMNGRKRSFVIEPQERQ